MAASAEDGRGLQEQAEGNERGWMRPGQRECGQSFLLRSLKSDKHPLIEQMQVGKEERKQIEDGV